MDRDFDVVFQEFAAQLRTVRGDGAIRGCTADEMSQLSEHWGGRVPGSFQSFLKVMGAEAGPLWRDSFHLMPGLLELDNAWLFELAEELDIELPAGELHLINAHDGYEFQWLLLDETLSVDPPVWQLLETGAPQLKLVSNSFSTYVEDAVSSVAAFYASHPDYDYWNARWPR